MKKWSLILWFAAIVGAALIFTACGEDDDGGGGETFTDVTSDYTLKASEATDAAADASGLVIASALKSNSTGDVTIILTGTVKTGYQAIAVADDDDNDDNTPPTATVTPGNSVSDWNNIWGEPGDSAEPGVYGAAYISGMITQSIAAGTVAVRQKNEALRLFGGKELLQSDPTAPVVQYNDSPTIWIPAAGATGTPTRWKAYVNDSTNVPYLTEAPFGILIWDGGTADPKFSNKTATLEVESATISVVDSKYTAAKKDLLAKYIIDYSAVVFE
jgi:hypothetical protein